MPELPEVETVKNVLLPIIKDRKIIAIEVLRKSIVNGLDKEFISFFKNETFLNITRRGKFLLIHLTNNKVLISHLRMEGKYIELLESEENTKYARVVFHLDNGHKLCYDDSRSFGRMIMSNEDNYLKEKEIAKLGPEPFEVDDVSNLVKKCERISLPIKTALLTQTLITGLGNIYVDEVLFASKIHPLTPAKFITKNEWETIIKESKRILTEAIKAGGSTIKSYHPGKDISGEFQTKLLAYGRKGEKCVSRHAFMRFIAVNGRGTTYCPKCQIKLGAPIKIAIVGKIASGKSTVLDEFVKGGYCTISSDEIVHKLYTQNDVQNLINKRLKVNGEKSFVDNLRDHVEKHPADLEKLEKIVHPLVKKEIELTFKNSKSPLLVAEVPLLFKAKMQDMFDVIIGVDIDEKIQIKRLNLRDKEKSAFLKRINDENNMFEEHRLDLDFIVNNNDTLSKLRKDTREIIRTMECRRIRSL